MSHTSEADSEKYLYPDIEPYRQGMLRVSDLHEIYFEESGNPHGKPVVVVHGGPGGGSSPKLRRFFNPEKYRIVLFDQRGCGKSLPHACLEDNTTWHLVDDMEKLRKHLGIDKWQVFGGSWGSNLSLIYAENHPASVTELVLRGIFLLRKEEIDWFYQRGAHMIFPDTWEPYLNHIPQSERHDLVAAYHKRLNSPDPAVQIQAARIWSQWEGSTSFLYPDPTVVENYGDDRFAIAFARIECHYFVNKGFLDQEDYILRNIDKIRHIPGFIVHGRYDVVCPVKNAFDLHRAWPEAQLVITPNAGHAATDPPNCRELVSATDRFAT